MIHLVGPGGAGKSTTGAALAAQLGTRCVDLDAEFVARYGNISAYLDTRGYDAYAERNVTVYLDVAADLKPLDVVALSSGFMSYRADVHPDLVRCREQIASDESTFVLLPSLDVETCVAEIVRRQLQRPFARARHREEEIIRERFPIYAGLAARKVETMRTIDSVVTELSALAVQQAATED